MAHKLFWNVSLLYEQIETHFADKTPEEGPGAQMAVCGHFLHGTPVGNGADNKSAVILLLHLWHLGLLPVQVSEQ